MLFNEWSQIVHALLVGSLGYCGIIAWLRVSGKRTLSQWNAFDAVVTFALGSMLATVTLSRDASLAQALTAFALFIALQFVVTWLAVRSPALRRLVKAQPTLLVRDGRMLDDVLVRERVTQGEVLAALRDRGFASVGEVHAVVLETSGKFSVIGTRGDRGGSTLADVEGYGASADGAGGARGRG